MPKRRHWLTALGVLLAAMSLAACGGSDATKKKENAAPNPDRTDQ